MKQYISCSHSIHYLRPIHYSTVHAEFHTVKSLYVSSKLEGSYFNYYLFPQLKVMENRLISNTGGKCTFEHVRN